MYDIYIARYGFEECAPDKAPVRLVYGYNAVHYILSGHGWFDGQYLGPGEGFVGVKNNYVDYYPDPQDPWTYVFIRIEGADSLKALKDRGIAVAPFTFKYTYSQKLGEICAFIEELLPDFQKGPTGNSVPEGMRSRALAMLLLSYHEPPAGCERKEKRSLRACHVEAAERYIEQNYHRHVTIDEIAAELHLSRGYLRNIFHEYRGKSPRDYLMETRINRAKELLSVEYDGRKMPMNISTVAVSVGYEDALQFSKFFKKHTGCSPSEYKAKMS